VEALFTSRNGRGPHSHWPAFRRPKQSGVSAKLTGTWSCGRRRSGIPVRAQSTLFSAPLRGARHAPARRGRAAASISLRPSSLLSSQRGRGRGGGDGQRGRARRDPPPRAPLPRYVPFFSFPDTSSSALRMYGSQDNLITCDCVRFVPTNLRTNRGISTFIT